MRIVKISELPAAESIEGLYTIGVDSNNRSVKVPVSAISGGGSDYPPVGGVPYEDLSSEVQASLDKADRAALEDISLQGTTGSIQTRIGSTGMYLASGDFNLYPSEKIKVTAAVSSTRIYIVDATSGDITSYSILTNNTGEVTYTNNTNSLKKIAIGTSASSKAFTLEIETIGLPKEALRADVQASLAKADTAVQDISGKQDVLVSGTNIKTINNQSLLGSGNITIEGGGGGGISEAYSIINIGQQSNFQGTYPDGYYTLSYSGSGTLYDAVNAVWTSGKVPVLFVELSVHTSYYGISLWKDQNGNFNGHDRAENGNFTIDVVIGSNNRINTRSVGTYSKPSNGIPKTDLASAVQTSLGKADTAVQPAAIANLESKMAIVAASGTALTASVNNYYLFSSEVGTLAITLTTPSDTTHITKAVFMLTTGESPAVTFAGASGINVIAQDGFSIEASTTYEINAIFNGTKWVLAAMKLNTTDIQPS